MLRIEALDVYGLEPVSFELAPGECLAVQGPSGSGKTVLLRAIADLDPAPGRIYLKDRERNQMPAPEWRAHVRYAAAEPGWWAETPREHFPSTFAGKLNRVVSDMGLKPEQLDQDLSRLSTGERQRLALVRAMADKPDVLLLDEPTGALDGRATKQAEKLIKLQMKSGRGIILVSHDPAQVKRLAHRKLVIRGGKVRVISR